MIRVEIWRPITGSLDRDPVPLGYGAKVLRTIFVALLCLLSCHCFPPESEDSTSVWTGTYELDGPLKLIQLRRLTRIEGSLVISSTAEESELVLADLVSISGDLIIRNTPSVDSSATISFPRLMVLGGGLEVGSLGDPSTVMLPSLGRVDFIEVSEGAVNLHMGKLTEIRSHLRVRDTDLTEIRFPRLSHVRGDVQLLKVNAEGGGSILIDVPSLASMDGGLTLKKTSPINFLAPELHSIQGDILLDGAQEAILNLESLTDVDGSLSIEQSQLAFIAPKLARITGHLVLDRVTYTGAPQGGRLIDLYLPELVELEGRLSIHRVDNLEAISVASLQRVGQNIRLSESPSIRVIDLSELAEIGSDFEMDNLAAPQILTPSLSSINGSLLVRRLSLLNFSAPLLSQIIYHMVLDTVAIGKVDLPLLANIGGRLDMGGLAVHGEVNFEGLSAVGGSVLVLENRSFATFSLPRLTTIGGGQAGDLHFEENVDMDTINLPLLRSVGGAITIRENQGLDSEKMQRYFANVTTSSVEICGNGDEPPCNLNKSNLAELPF